eukprot:4090453-Pleurochrysis_carterae.AAC.1
MAAVVRRPSGRNGFGAGANGVARAGGRGRARRRMGAATDEVEWARRSGKAQGGRKTDYFGGKRGGCD